MRTLLLALTLLPASLSAQTPQDSFALAASQDAPSPRPLIGTYTGPDAALNVTRAGRGLVLTLAGQPAFDAFADAAANPTFNVRAEALLRDAFAGSTDRLADALPAHRQEAGTQDFARLLTTLADRLGTVESVDAIGTTHDADRISETFVRVRFAEGEELLKLKWRDDRLALITRGVLPNVMAFPVHESDRHFAVLDAAGDPTTVLVFGNGKVTVRGAAHTLVAAQAH